MSWSPPICLEVVRGGVPRGFPGGNEEVTEVLRSYESTRHPSWSANSFMVSVTDPGGAQGGVLGPLHVNST
ncbi:hypothetical protein GTY65_09225 [Streptomyces sp. SID8379]|nr:hypothetical protein [Streptomyces sp. SID8379]